MKGEKRKEILRNKDRDTQSPWFLMTCHMLITGTCWDSKFHKISLYSYNKYPLFTNSNFSPTLEIQRQQPSLDSTSFFIPHLL